MRSCMFMYMYMYMYVCMWLKEERERERERERRDVLLCSWSYRKKTGGKTQALLASCSLKDT